MKACIGLQCSLLIPNFRQLPFGDLLQNETLGQQKMEKQDWDKQDWDMQENLKTHLIFLFLSKSVYFISVSVSFLFLEIWITLNTSLQYVHQQVVSKKIEWLKNRRVWNISDTAGWKWMAKLKMGVEDSPFLFFLCSLCLLKLSLSFWPISHPQSLLVQYPDIINTIINMINIFNNLTIQAMHKFIINHSQWINFTANE